MNKILLLLIPIFSFAQKSKPQNLFNGKDLSGWEIYGTEKWYVEDKKLICESGPDKGYGYLATNEKFKDFEISLMFKPLANGNSGVFFHSDITGTRIAGWQAEVAPPGSFSGGIYESYKRGWLIKPPKEIDNVKMGEWNTMKIKVIGTEVTTWVNGVQMIYLNDPAIGEVDGKIALQIHDGGGIRVEWKKIKITKL
ncbi:DUF1080 domain-containing protein [Lacihabitans sp. LS3-19]|uniref:3-keto-disaccharide hydrolase n=1 Tax=Lacihabitans sp. LS3-19 TaxID=2487335 RepID=UPI0020CBF556|nr:DUF1080 domain-containing protein [Lacihabitans sp. LS3-19]MCP9767598.1 DUF1080 domain-containing protein [Lacihabitans sp. LS3-19]